MSARTKTRGRLIATLHTCRADSPDRAMGPWTWPPLGPDARVGRSRESLQTAGHEGARRTTRHTGRPTMDRGTGTVKSTTRIMCAGTARADVEGLAAAATAGYGAPGRAPRVSYAGNRLSTCPGVRRMCQVGRSPPSDVGARAGATSGTGSPPGLERLRDRPLELGGRMRFAKHLADAARRGGAGVAQAAA